MTVDGSTETLHGSCVAFDRKAVLFLGASGSGKSATSLELISLGAQLIADDQVVLTASDQGISATALPSFEGKIEARGIGILDVAHANSAILELVVDLDQTELKRLPPYRKHKLLGVELDLIYGRDNLHLSAGLKSRLLGARAD